MKEVWERQGEIDECIKEIKELTHANVVFNGDDTFPTIWVNRREVLSDCVILPESKNRFIAKLHGFVAGLKLGLKIGGNK